MGECVYRLPAPAGRDDAKMLRALTDPAVVCRHLLPSDWCVPRHVPRLLRAAASLEQALSLLALHRSLPSPIHTLLFSWEPVFFSWSREPEPDSRDALMPMSN